MENTSSLPSLLLQQAKILVTKYSVLNERSFSLCFTKLFQQQLHPSASGHPSINSLLFSLASAKVLLLTYENFAVTIRPSRQTLMETKGVSEDWDLMELDTLASKNVLTNLLPPEDTVLRYVLPVEELPTRLREGQTFPVVITQVESPSKFWFNLQQNGHFDIVKNIMNRMDLLYRGVKGDTYRVVSADRLRPGNVLAARYQTGGFHRVLVIKVVDPSVVRLFFVDYGTVDNQKLKHCRFLHRDFSILPGQAIQARLWGVRPLGGGRRWGKGNKARDKLVELVDTLEGGLVARIRAGVTRKEVTVKGEDELEEERGLALSLVDVLTGDDGLDIATDLVMEGLAEWELWNVLEEDVMEGYDGTVCKVVKYSGHDKEGSSVKDAKFVESNVMASDSVSGEVTSTPLLELLTMQEDIMRRLGAVLQGEGGEDKQARAKSWARERCLVEISLKREERKKFELTWAIDREL